MSLARGFEAMKGVCVHELSLYFGGEAKGGSPSLAGGR